MANVSKNDRENLLKNLQEERLATLGSRRPGLITQPDSLNTVDDNSRLSLIVASDAKTVSDFYHSIRSHYTSRRQSF